MYVSFWPQSPLWMICLESKKSAFESKVLHSEEVWSYQTWLKSCLGHSLCDSHSDCGKWLSTVLSVMLDMVLNIWNVLATWEVIYSPTLGSKLEAYIWRPISVHVTHADKLLTLGLGICSDYYHIYFGGPFVWIIYILLKKYTGIMWLMLLMHLFCFCRRDFWNCGKRTC